jgi:hypothetical protein
LFLIVTAPKTERLGGSCGLVQASATEEAEDGQHDDDKKGD